MAKEHRQEYRRKLALSSNMVVTGNGFIKEFDFNTGTARIYDKNSLTERLMSHGEIIFWDNFCGEHIRAKYFNCERVEYFYKGEFIQTRVPSPFLEEYNGELRSSDRLPPKALQRMWKEIWEKLTGEQ